MPPTSIPLFGLRSSDGAAIWASVPLLFDYGDRNHRDPWITNDRFEPSIPVRILTRLMSMLQARFSIMLAWLALSVCSQALAQTDHCSQPTEALAATNWESIKPSHFQFEAMFSIPVGWVGLDHVFGTGERVQARWRSAIPFLVPTMVQSFPGPNTMTPVQNPRPVFYLHATEVASYFAAFDAGEVRLRRLRVRRDHRELPVSKGITTFTFAAGSPGRFLVPIAVRRLSQTLMEVKPRDRLAPGQYLITIGSQEDDGFEFEINCSH